MKKRTAIALASITLVVGMAAGLFLGVASNVDLHESTEVVSVVPATPESILKAVNKVRADHGVKPLKSHPSVAVSAQLKSDDMWDRDYRSHFLPGEADGITLTDEMAYYVDTVCSRSSENFVYNDDAIMTIDKAMDSWMNSEPHKKAILDPQYTYTGIGVSHGHVAVQHFCVAK